VTRFHLCDVTRVSYTPRPPTWKTSPRISFMQAGVIPGAWISQPIEYPPDRGYDRMIIDSLARLLERI
jgi:hypothetical protein